MVARLSIAEQNRRGLKCCSSCRELKPLDDYTKDSNSIDGLDHYCRQCKSDKNSRYYYQKSDEYKEEQKQKHKEYNKIYRKTHKRKYKYKYRYKKMTPALRLYMKLKKDKFHQYISDIKSAGCCICGEKEECCLDFHHLNPATKLNDISDLSLRNFDRINAELQKCVLVCKNCHRKIHSKIIESPPESMLIKLNEVTSTSSKKDEILE